MDGNVRVRKNKVDKWKLGLTLPGHVPDDAFGFREGRVERGEWRGAGGEGRVDGRGWKNIGDGGVGIQVMQGI